MQSKCPVRTARLQRGGPGALRVLCIERHERSLAAQVAQDHLEHRQGLLTIRSGARAVQGIVPGGRVLRKRKAVTLAERKLLVPQGTRRAGRPPPLTRPGH